VEAHCKPASTIVGIQAASHASRTLAAHCYQRRTFRGTGFSQGKIPTAQNPPFPSLFPLSCSFHSSFLPFPMSPSPFFTSLSLSFHFSFPGSRRFDQTSAYYMGPRRTPGGLPAVFVARWLEARGLLHVTFSDEIKFQSTLKTQGNNVSSIFLSCPNVST